MFSINTFFLGILLFGCFYASNFIYSLICILNKVKIEEFAVFYHPWFSIYRETVVGTNFILGWLPFGGYVKPLGNYNKEKAGLTNEEIPIAFSNKPRFLQIGLLLVPWLTYIVALLISVILLSYTSFIEKFEEIIIYMIDAFNTMFSHDQNIRYQFIEKSIKITDNENIILFAFSLLAIAMILFMPLSMFINQISIANKNTKVKKILSTLLTISILWLMVWETPKFIFSFFSLNQNLIYVSSFLFGVLVCGIVFFFLTIYILKKITQNINIALRNE